MLRRLLKFSTYKALNTAVRDVTLVRTLSAKAQHHHHDSVAGRKITTNKQTLDIHHPTDNGALETHSYPYVWLRDNCQCEKCYLKSSKSRFFLLRDLDLDIKPKTVEENSNMLTITWPDNHQSFYDLDWLKDRRFTKDNTQYRQALHARPTKLWGKDMKNNVPKITFKDLITDDKSLHTWLVNLEEIGIQLITDAPRQSGILDMVAKRVAHLKRNNYGELFTVKSKWNASNVAYTGATLGLHTDLPFYHYTPGVQMLHCIEQVETEGGDNTFADGFYAANIMKNEHPDLYQILKRTTVDYYDVGFDAYKFYKLTMIPVVEEDEHGEIYKITYNNQVRDSYLSIPLDEVGKLYEAMVTFEKLISDQRCCVTHKMQNGEIACFHNYRVLHGREGFSVHGSGERHLEGGYIDWDELRSRRRVLEGELAMIPH